MTLVAKLTLDSSDYDKKISGLSGRAKKTLGTVAKVGTAMVATSAAAIVALTKKAIDSYAEYEQLVGGIKTLYGEGSEAADEMMKHASEAWKTSGMSANEYMETAIESSAAMIKALDGDTERAAQLMDMSIIDMADNVNKMGTSMEGVQNAYRGFSRGNFTMLDNLALGFAGTKEGMEELLEAAEEYAAKNGDIRDFSIDSYADIVEAIHIVQDEMGITGTTANEASTTIQGSLSSAKAAWQNLLTGLADGNADLEQLIDNLVESIIGKNGEGGVLNNILPAVRRALNGVIQLIVTVAPKIVPILVEVITENLPQIIEAGIQIVVALITGIIQALPQLIAALPQLFASIKTAFIENAPALKEAGRELLVMVGNGILGAFDWLKEKLSGIVGTIKEFLGNKWSEIREDTRTKWTEIKTIISDKLSEAKEIATQKSEDMRNMISEKLGRIKQAYEENGGGIRGVVEATMQALKEVITLRWDTINTLTGGKLDGMREKITSIFNEIKTFISEKLEVIKGLFNFEWSFPHIKMPHFSWYWEDVGGLLSIPRFSIEWYKKAYNQPYLFNKPTLAGFGDGVGGEMVYGHKNLMHDIREAVGSMATAPVINIYPQKGQSETEIAKEVQKVLLRWDKQRKAAAF